MRLRFINPNTTASMTQKVLDAAKSVNPPGVEIDAVTSQRGPAAIQGEADGLLALPGLLEQVDVAIADGMDVIAIACFDDTGITEVRKRAGRVPVLGIGQSAFLDCLLRGRRFSVVTTLAISIPVIEANLEQSGLVGGCARVRASGVPVLALEEPGGEARERVAAEIVRSLDEDDISAVVLGCAGMADLAQMLSQRFDIPVVDGVVAATRLATAVI